MYLLAMGIVMGVGVLLLATTHEELFEMKQEIVYDIKQLVSTIRKA